jgi:hypothetical protein
MVIIGVEEGYREGALVAMRAGLCRSAECCGELVELSFYAGIWRVFTGGVWKSLFHVERFAQRNASVEIEVLRDPSHDSRAGFYFVFARTSFSQKQVKCGVSRDVPRGTFLA